MAVSVRLQLMDRFVIYINENQVEYLSSKTRKGASLIEYLILNNGTSVPNYRLLSTFWQDKQTTNPENALKTLISRLRAMLNEMVPNLGRCIVADRGSYHWENMPGMSVDYYEIRELIDTLSHSKENKQTQYEMYDRLLTLYCGDLLQSETSNEWVMSMATDLHESYVKTIYAYIDMLEADKDYERMIEVCRKTLDIDSFDDRLHMKLMTALVQTDRNSDALVQYRHAMQLNYRYLGVKPSDDLQEFYQKIRGTDKNIEYTMENIRRELLNVSEQRGALVCEYSVFKEIFNLQIRNLERLGATMFLGVINIDFIGDIQNGSIMSNNIMNILLGVLEQNLRKGDTVSRFSPTTFALLLPTVNYTTGNTIMERVRQAFYNRCPNSNVSFTYRITPVSSKQAVPKE